MMNVWMSTMVLLLTALGSSVVEAKLKYDDRPNLNDLRQLPVKDGVKDIVAEIQNDYIRLGGCLLEDEGGNKVHGIEKAKHYDPVVITEEILRQWRQGKGKEPVTWRMLVNCLREAQLNVAADDIEGALSEEANVPVSTSSTTGQKQQPTSSTATGAEGLSTYMVAVVVSVSLGILTVVISFAYCWSNSLKKTGSGAHKPHSVERMSGLPDTGPPDSATEQSEGTGPKHTPKDFRKFGKPNIRDLCEYVGAVIPARWEPFGRFVGVKEGTLQAIQANHAGQPDWQNKCFTDVFSKWHDGMTSVYTWERVAEVLQSEAVGSKGQLDILYEKLEAKGKSDTK